jgi:hypothetical protein
MTLLYPYTDDRRDGFELWHSIRSMCRYGKIDYVVVVGDKPSWYTGEFIKYPDIPGRKEWSIVVKVLQCPYDDVLYCHDDIFALQPFDKEVYNTGPLQQWKGLGKYPERIRATMSIFPNGLNYDCHTPMYINLSDYRQAHSRCDWTRRDYLSKSVYGNHVNPLSTMIPDVKLRTDKDFIETSWPFFSTNNRTARKIGLPLMYNVPSPYEAK